MAVFLFGEGIQTAPIIAHIFYIGDFLYNFIFLIISIMTLFVWGIKTNNLRIKKQSKILVISSIIPFALNLLSQTLLPLMGIHELPLMGQLYSLIMITGTYIVITRYKFLKIPEKYISEEVVNEMLDMVIIINEKGHIIRITKHTLDILGFDEKELLKQSISFIFDDKDKEELSLDKIKETIRKYTDMILIMKNGQKIPVNVSCKPIIDSRIKDFLGAILVIQDIRMMHELQSRNQELFNEKERFKTTLLSVGDGVISTDHQGNIELINKIGEQLTGWRQSEVLGKPLSEVFNIVNEISRIQCENPVLQVLKTGKTLVNENHPILISKNGTERLIEDCAAPIMDEVGRISGVVLVFRDCTEKKEKQNQIEYLSYHDQLTGLYNRRFFEEELARIDVGRNLPLSIVMADVNGLKLINDTFGHVMGDELLKKVADVIQKGCRAEDIIARLGGDEFIILLPKTDASQTEEIIKNILTLALDEKVGSMDISVSCGYEIKDHENIRVQEILKKAEDRMYKKKLFESPSMRGKTIHAIIRALYEKNKREEQHSNRVSLLCKRMGLELGFTEGDINELKTVGLLHDIGKIAIDENILNKHGKLNAAEWEEIKRHTDIGYRILSTVNDMSEIANYVLHHHERWNGTGYPKGLKGQEIPFVSRIIAIADAYDAMTSERSYRLARSEDIAIKELQKNAGIQFDPQLVNIFIEKVLG